jgi:hypothetical protein
MAGGGYTIENIYEPGASSFTPSSEGHYLGKQNLISAGQMGMTTDPRTANQLGELSRNLNVGTKVIELMTMDMPTWDTIPQEHWHEIRRKAKFADAKVSLHAPVQATDPAGFGQQGWEESNRELVERQLKDVMDKAAIIDKEGNMPITIHGSNTSGSTFKMVDGKKEYDLMVAVDRETGQLAPAKEETKYYPGGENGEIRKETLLPGEQLKMINGTKWDDSLTKIEFQRENADKILNGVNPLFQGRFIDIIQGHTKINELNQGEYQEFKKIVSASEHIKEAQREMMATFSKAYKFAEEDKNQKELDYLKKLSENYSNQLGYKDGKPTVMSHNPSTQSEAIFTMVQGLKPLQPKLFESIEDFSINKGSETFANVAMHSYKKHGEGAPIISIENLYQGMGFSQGKDLKNLVEKSQERFVKKLTEQKNISKSKAEQIAKKLIGVTFDVGHLNVSKSKGFTDKDLVKEAEEIRKHVKHVHITDNFGYSDTHLPIGMGNVPVEELLNALGEDGKRARKINEVGGWYQHFKTNPFPQLLEAVGSQIYSSGEGPYWQQAGGFQQSYLEGYGQMLPQTHYSMFGAGFSQLPASLGGSVGQSGGGRMGGGDF